MQFSVVIIIVYTIFQILSLYSGTNKNLKPTTTPVVEYFVFVLFNGSRTLNGIFFLGEEEKIKI